MNSGGGGGFEVMDGYMNLQGFVCMQQMPAGDNGAINLQQGLPLAATAHLLHQQQSPPRVAAPAPSNGGAGNGLMPTTSTVPPSRYESQKRRDWNTFGQYLKNHRPPLALAKCSGAHVLEFLRYLDQFGKTKVHRQGCPFFGHPQPPSACGCPLRQAWGSLDALIGRLRAAFEENGGKPESNPFGARAVRLYLRDVRETQAKARGIAYEKKKRKRPLPPPAAAAPAPSAPALPTLTTAGTDHHHRHHHHQQQQYSSGMSPASMNSSELATSSDTVCSSSSVGQMGVSHIHGINTTGAGGVPFHSASSLGISGPGPDHHAYHRPQAAAAHPSPSALIPSFN